MSPLRGLSLDYQAPFEDGSPKGVPSKFPADAQRTGMSSRSLNHLIVHRGQHRHVGSSVSFDEIHQLLVLKETGPHVVALASTDDQLHRTAQRLVAIAHQSRVLV